jgi:hypothetical protein
MCFPTCVVHVKSDGGYHNRQGAPFAMLSIVDAGYRSFFFLS